MPINTDFTVHADSKPQILRLIIRNHILLLKAAMPMLSYTDPGRHIYK